MSAIHESEEEFFRILDEDGKIIENSDVPDISDEKFLKIYEDMRLMRRFDIRAINFQRRGRIGTYPSLAGQEGSQIPSAHALHEDDWIFPTYREHGSKYVHGMGLHRIFLELMGDSKGNSPPEGVNVFPTAIPIATQIPHAVGMSWASNLKGDDAVSLCYFGDGATSEGDFHEGMNFAGVFDTPTVLFCNNNQWAISVPRERQTASETIAQKAKAYGFEGIQVDGMDPLAVYKVTKDAVEKARSSGGENPTLIEAVQYRYGAHTTADDPSKYRDNDKTREWKRKDPIQRLRNFLLETGRLDEEREDEIRDKIEEKVVDAIEKAESVNESEPSEMFENVYARTPEGLRQQHEYLEKLREKHGDESLTRD